jgi:hypothetical protein
MRRFQVLSFKLKAENPVSHRDHRERHLSSPPLSRGRLGGGWGNTYALLCVLYGLGCRHDLEKDVGSFE